MDSMIHGNRRNKIKRMHEQGFTALSIAFEVSEYVEDVRRVLRNFGLIPREDVHRVTEWIRNRGRV